VDQRLGQVNSKFAHYGIHVQAIIIFRQRFKMKRIKSTFLCLTVLLMISGSFSIHGMASPQGQTGEFPETKQQDPLDIPEEDNSILTPQADTALPERINVPSETIPVLLIHIEVSSAANLNTLQDLGFACNQLEDCDVETDQTGITTLKEYGFNYEVLHKGVAVQIDPGINSLDALVNRYGGNDTDYNIPDGATSNCGFSYSTINITDAPTGAIVDYVEYRIRVLHTWPSDLQLLISSGQNTSAIIWDFLGGTDDGGYDDDVENDEDIYLNHRLINTAFDNSEPVNQYWYLDAYDCAGGDTGTIDYLELWIWYDDGGAARPNLTPYSPSGWDFPIVPSSVDGTNTVNELYTTSTTFIDWAVINNGSIAAPEFDSCLFLDSSLLSCWFTNAGLATNYYAFIMDWVLNITPSIGWHTLRLETDYNQEVFESNENDNVWSYQFYWNPRQIRIYLPSLSTQKNFFEGPFELEPNNKYTQGNGPLISNRIYSGSSNDSDDYLYFTTTTSGTIQVDLTGHTGQGVQLLLYYQSVEAGHVKQCLKAPGTTSCTINHTGGPGLYYVRIYTGETPYTNQTYSLKATYP
jgi:hypothetical protein